jgi:predicted dehydrogenase
MKTLRTGVIGVGYIGPAHIEALRRVGEVEVIAICDINAVRANEYAKQQGISKVYLDYKKMLEDKQIDVIHNCTPNHMHFEINKQIIRAGKHVVSEKPLAISSLESAELVRMAQQSGVVNAVNFNYRYYPLVQQAAVMVKEKALGRVFAIQGCYKQDWLMYDTDWNWRLESKYAGPSRAMADIGSHWFDLISFLLRRKITRVFGDLASLHEYRKKPKKQVETFAGKTLKPSDYTKVKISTECYGQVLMEFEDGIKGMVCVSQVSAGRKNHIVFEVNGTEQTLGWDHERPNELMIGRRNEPNQLMLKDPVLLDKSVKDYAHYPAGHNEGYPTCVKNFCRNVYRYIKDRRRKIDFSTFEDGHNAIAVVEAVLASHKSNSWVEVKY